MSTDQQVARKVADIVALYLYPPENAGDKCRRKATMQALERAQGCVGLTGLNAALRQNHEEHRHGTTTLFAALED